LGGEGAEIMNFGLFGIFSIRKKYCSPFPVFRLCWLGEDEGHPLTTLPLVKRNNYFWVRRPW